MMKTNMSILRVLGCVRTIFFFLLTTTASSSAFTILHQQYQQQQHHHYHRPRLMMPTTTTALLSSTALDDVVVGGVAIVDRPTRSRFRRLGRRLVSVFRSGSSSSKQLQQQQNHQASEAEGSRLQQRVVAPSPLSTFATTTSTKTHSATAAAITTTSSMDKDSLVAHKQQTKSNTSSLLLQFVGTHTVTTTTATTTTSHHQQQQQQQQQPVQVSQPALLLGEFFVHNRNLLFPNNHAVDCAPILSSELVQQWTQLAEQQQSGIGPIVEPVVHGNNMQQLVNTDSVQHGLFRIQAPLQMPGLQVVSESLIGYRLQLPTSSESSSESTSTSSLQLPEYQFTLLDSKLSATGPGKWLFQQLTKYLKGTNSFTRVTANIEKKNDDKDNNNNNNNSIVFQTTARLQTSIALPRAVARVLPVNVERLERQGSQAVQQLLQTELEPALNGFAQAYSDYYYHYHHCHSSTASACATAEKDETTMTSHADAKTAKQGEEVLIATTK